MLRPARRVLATADEERTNCRRIEATFLVHCEVEVNPLLRAQFAADIPDPVIERLAAYRAQLRTDAFGPFVAVGYPEVRNSVNDDDRVRDDVLAVTRSSLEPFGYSH